MARVPDEAVKAALAAYKDVLSDRPSDMVLSDERLIRITLEAAAPVLADHVASAILAHMNAHAPKDGASRRKWRRILGIGAQVASLAFHTEEDIKREAAQALAEGNFVGCFTREDDGRA